MTASRKPFIHLVLLLGILPTCINAIAQPIDLDPEKWGVELSKKDYSANESLRSLDSTLHYRDSAFVTQFLDELADRGRSNYHFKARFNCLKAIRLLFFKANLLVKTPDLKNRVKSLLDEAIDLAYRSEDDYLIAFVSRCYAHTISNVGEISLTVMYAMNGLDMHEKLSYKIPPGDYQFLADMLYRVREYKDCIRYGRKAVIEWRNSPNEHKGFTVSCLNTVALGYHRQGQYDSAFIFYNQALALAREINRPVWIGIVSGNMAQIYYALGQYDTAYNLLKYDYGISNDSGFYDNAAHSLQWAARANLALGNKSKALAEVREAFQLLKLWPDPNYLRNTYFTATQIFREMEAFDSAFYYNNLYSSINDSLERVIATSSMAISKAKLNDEMSRYNIQTLNKEKRSQLLLRNFIIASIIVLSIIALLILNRKRLKEKLKKEKAELEKLRMEQEVSSAREQLRMFTENIIEKTTLIEKLEIQVKGKDATAEHQEIISALSQQTILTEEEWLQFKSLFEKIYPGFFIKLRDKFPDITLAEQRMAALIRLRLTTRQIASILGISVDSVHKSRQRLRLRFHVSADANLDEIVASL